jgi:hypothetical protein
MKQGRRTEAQRPCQPTSPAVRRRSWLRRSGRSCRSGRDCSSRTGSSHRTGTAGGCDARMSIRHFRTIKDAERYGARRSRPQVRAGRGDRPAHRVGQGRWRRSARPGRRSSCLECRSLGGSWPVARWWTSARQAMSTAAGGPTERRLRSGCRAARDRAHHAVLSVGRRHHARRDSMSASTARASARSSGSVATASASARICSSRRVRQAARIASRMTCERSRSPEVRSAKAWSTASSARNVIVDIRQSV